MKELIGKRCRMQVLVNGTSLSYTAKLNDMSSTHVHITDKFNKEYFFRIQDIVEISEVQ
jgi:hypothetical protein